MNDAERDAWLREALRHAPDSEALPPSAVSEAILLKARAAARSAAPARLAGSRDAPANPWTALWDWLARPAVATGFASVMAATLVGLMWWDRPMDEGMARPPALARDRAPAAVSPAAPPAAPPATVTDATRPTPNVRPLNEAANDAAPDDGAVRRQRSAPEQAGAIDAKRAVPAPEPAERSVDLLAKARPLPLEKKDEAPAPFPSPEMQREAPSPRKSLDAAAANDARKKDGDAGRSRAAEEAGRAAVPPTTRPVAAAPAAPAPPVGAAEPASDQADAPRLQQQPRSAFGAIREQGAAGLAAKPVPSASVPAAPLRSESRQRGAEALLRADASARVLAAIAAEPERWLRQTTGGDTVALDAGWRAWLAEVDAAAAGRWRTLDTAVAPSDAAPARDGSTTLRLVNAGRVAAIVRLDGTSVQIDAAPGTGADRWQATLPAAAAERLRSTARRLPP